MEKLIDALSGTQVFLLIGGVLFGVYCLIHYGIEAARRATEANARARVDCQRLEVAKQLADAGHMSEAVEQLLRTADPAGPHMAGKSDHELAATLAAALAAAGAEAGQVEEVVGLFWAAEPPLKLAVCETVARMQENQSCEDYGADVILAAARGLLKGTPAAKKAAEAATGR
jgi:hypothetical protein